MNIALSIATAEAATPAPTYGTSAVSSSPCTVPSSPCGPCSTGKTASTGRAAPPSSDASRAEPSGAGTTATGSPSTLQPPSRAISTGITS